MNNCPICLENMNDNNQKWICPHCKKEFHDSCISIWFASGIGCNNCPLCRQIIPIDISIILQARQQRLDRFQSRLQTRRTVRNNMRNRLRNNNGSILPITIFNYIPRYYFIICFTSTCSIIVLTIILLYLLVFSKFYP